MLTLQQGRKRSLLSGVVTVLVKVRVSFLEPQVLTTFDVVRHCFCHVEVRDMLVPLGVVGGSLKT